MLFLKITNTNTIMNNLDLRATLKGSIEDELKTINPKCFKCQYYLLFYEKGLPLEAVIILSKLFDWEGKQANKKEFYIFKTIKELQKETCLSRYKQDKGIKILKWLELIKVFHKGIPRKRHFLLNMERLSIFIFSNEKIVKKHPYNLFKVNNLM